MTSNVACVKVYLKYVLSLAPFYLFFVFDDAFKNNYIYDAGLEVIAWNSY